MRLRPGSMPFFAASFLMLAACAGNDDVLSPSSPDALKASADVVAVPSLALVTSEDTIALGDTATVAVIGSNAGAGSMYYYAQDASIVGVGHANGTLKATKLGKTRLVGVQQIAGYPTVSIDVVVAATGSARHGLTGQTTTAVTTAPVITVPTATVPVTTSPTSGTVAELPRVLVDTRMVAPTGRTITVAAGANLQSAINSAKGGDVLLLAAGATFVGNFTLPVRGDAGWVTIRSSTPDASLPAAGVRVKTSNASLMPKILSPNSAPAIQTAPGTQGWRLVALEVSAAPGVALNYGLIGFGDGSTAQKTVASIPSRLILDRSYVHGNSTLSLRRCVGLNSATSAVIDSYLGECHDRDNDSQAIWGWNGPGPFKIENNHLEAGHEIVGFGGPTPSIANLVPSDIEIRHNYITRPMAWRGVWNAKNLFEMKSGQRVLFENNILENNWVSAQNGFAIVLQTLTDDNLGSWVHVGDVTIRNNIIRNTAGGINLAARVAYGSTPMLPTSPTSRITITNNTLDVATDNSLGDNGIGIQLLNDLHDVSLQHNTVSARSMMFLLDGTNAQVGLTLLNNVFGKVNYQILGNSAGEGTSALAKFAPGYKVAGNVFTASSASAYPTGNFFPTSPITGVSNLSGSGYQGTDGVAPGANTGAILTATANVRD